MNRKNSVDKKLHDNIEQAIVSFVLSVIIVFAVYLTILKYKNPELTIIQIFKLFSLTDFVNTWYKGTGIVAMCLVFLCCKIPFSEIRPGWSINTLRPNP